MARTPPQPAQRLRACRIQVSRRRKASEHAQVSFVQPHANQLARWRGRTSGSADSDVLLLRLRRSLSCGSRLAITPTAAAIAGLLVLAAGPLVPPSLGGQRVTAPRADSQPLKNRPYAITPRRRALLNTIRFAEGTWKQGPAGYRTLYGGGRFSSLERHPERLVVKRYASAAAGAYQFLPGTWREAASKLELDSFDPHNQDQAALYLIDRRGVLHQIDQQGLTRATMAVLAKEWASFPTVAGRSAYGQPVKQADVLEHFYRSNLQTLAVQA